MLHEFIAINREENVVTVPSPIAHACAVARWLTVS